MAVGKVMKKDTDKVRLGMKHKRADFVMHNREDRAAAGTWARNTQRGCAAAAVAPAMQHDGLH